MYHLIKPGHVLRFATCPSSIVSPPGVPNPMHNDPGLVTPWPAVNTLGQVSVVSHPSGTLGEVAAEVATAQRPGVSLSRAASYSGIGRATTAQDRPIGQDAADFVGYCDGRSYTIASNQTVFSKDFSGCVMAAYSIGGQRRVAHAAASQVATMDCKQAFLTTIQGQGAVLHGWFRPFRDNVDGARRMAAFQRHGVRMGGNPYAITTFGVITAANQGWAIDAFKPTGIAGTSWVVTHIAQKPLSTSWIV